jgi:hypothetical protein
LGNHLLAKAPVAGVEPSVRDNIRVSVLRFATNAPVRGDNVGGLSHALAWSFLFK